VEEVAVNLLRLAVTELPKDVKEALQKAHKEETSEAGKTQLKAILDNVALAEKTRTPMCQDTGTIIFYIKAGSEVKNLDKIENILRKATSRATPEVPLRPNAVDPFKQKNTGDNTPAYIHWEVVPGDVFRVTFIAKGGGAENMSAVRMFAPAAGQQGIEDFVVETADKAGSNPCPPIIVGVGVGGNFEYSALLAKKALLRRPLGSHNPDPFYADMEKRLLERINNLGIGPQGMGGRCTALAVHVESFPCHIASMPAAVNIQCHSHRVLSFEL